MRTVELFRFLLYCAAGFTAALLVTMGLTAWGGSLPLSWLYQGVQWAQTLFLMVLPPLLWTRLHLRRPVARTLRLDHVDGRALLLTVCLMVCATPFLEWLAQFNDALPLPEAIAGELRAHQGEANAAMTLMMDNGSGPVAWGCLVLLVSVGTAIGEELMFRGAVLNLLLTSRLGRHMVAWTVGFIFSAIHFDPFGFLPRWLLGTLFVYLIYASGSLWTAVLAHALNNLLALVEFKAGLDLTAAFTDRPWLIGCSILATALLIYYWFRGRSFQTFR